MSIYIKSAMEGDGHGEPRKGKSKNSPEWNKFFVYSAKVTSLEKLTWQTLRPWNRADNRRQKKE